MFKLAYVSDIYCYLPFIIRATKQLVSGNICSREGNSFGTFDSKIVGWNFRNKERM